MRRAMLIVHESTLLRKIITNYALAELTDITVENANSASDALDILERVHFDIVVSAMEMSGLDGLDLYRRITGIERNRETPFLLITSTDTPVQRQRIAEAGVRHVLFSPYNGTQFAQMVDRASNPRKYRAYARFSIPGTEAVIHSAGEAFPARVVNISRSGIYCEMSPVEGWSPPLSPLRLDVRFPEEYGGARAGEITAVLLRLNVMQRSEDHVIQTLGIAFNFIDTPVAARSSLEMVLERVARDLEEKKEES